MLKNLEANIMLFPRSLLLQLCLFSNNNLLLEANESSVSISLNGSDKIVEISTSVFLICISHNEYYCSVKEERIWTTEIHLHRLILDLFAGRHLVNASCVIFFALAGAASTSRTFLLVRASCNDNQLPPPDAQVPHHCYPSLEIMPTASYTSSWAGKS